MSFLLVSFFTSGLKVSVSIGHVVKLVGPDAVLVCLGIVARPMIEIERIVVWNSRNFLHVSPVSSQGEHLLSRLSVGHKDLASITLGCTHHGESYASVACCTLHNGSPRTKKALLLGISQDENSRTVSAKKIHKNEELALLATHLTLPAGFWNSHLTRMLLPVAALSFWSRTSGVKPTALVILFP